MNEHRLTELVTNLKAGRMEYFDEFYQLTYRGVYSISLQLLKSKEEAENILQDTYLKFLEKLNDIDPNQSVLAYLMQTAKNLSLNTLEKYKKIQRDVDMTKIEDDSQGNNDDYVLKKMRQVLDEEENQIVIMHCLYDMTHKEISSALNKPIGTITWKYNNAIKKVREALEKDGYRK